MRLLTYFLAAALLWAVAASGPALSTPTPEPGARPDAPAAPARVSLGAYPK